MIYIFSVILFGVAAVEASPTLFSRQSSTSLSADQVNSYNTYTYFSKATYCGSHGTLSSWDCGAPCSNNGDFQLEASGGDGDSVQYWYAGFSPSLSSVIVAHQGTNTSQMQALATDLELSKGELDQTLFTQIPGGIQVHKGFRDEHAKTAQQVLSAVQSVMSKHQTNAVTLIGHSLGAALATLDSVYLFGQLPSSTSFKTVTYGQPRVGNKAFADYVDSKVPLTRITNQKDFVPIIPGKDLGYEHPSGEIHITDQGAWSPCSGQEDSSTSCSDGEVSNIFKGVRADHDGPYNGITLGRCE